MSSLAVDFERLLPLEGAVNLRDFGGYLTSAGRQVKRGMLYRSGAMNGLTDADESYLASLGIATVCDLRQSGERIAHPTRWCEPAGVHYWSRDYVDSTGVLAEVVAHNEPTPEAMRLAMIELYRDIAADHAPSYRVMFERLLAGHAPLLLNCAAGKDRTGVGAALILHVLGVPHETIVEDYLLTNIHANFDRLLVSDSAIARLARQKPEVAAPLFAADAEYLATMFETLEVRHGGVAAYLEDMLGVDDEAKIRLRALLVD